eukprot:403357750
MKRFQKQLRKSIKLRGWIEVEKLFNIVTSSFETFEVPHVELSTGKICLKKINRDPKIIKRFYKTVVSKLPDEVKQLYFDKEKEFLRQIQIIYKPMDGYELVTTFLEKQKASLEVSLKECSDLRLELSSSNQLYEALKKSFDALEAQTQADALSFEKKVQESTRMLEAQKTMMLELQLQKAEEKKEKESAKQALEKANLQNCILKDTIKRNESQARSDDNFLRSKIVKLEDQIRLLQADLAKKQKLSDTAVPVLNSTALSEALEENHCQESNSHDAQPEASHQQQPQGSKLLHTQESRKLEVTAKDSAPLRERDMNRQSPAAQTHQDSIQSQGVQTCNTQTQQQPSSVQCYASSTQKPFSFTEKFGGMFSNVFQIQKQPQSNLVENQNASGNKEFGGSYTFGLGNNMQQRMQGNSFPSNSDKPTDYIDLSAIQKKQQEFRAISGIQQVIATPIDSEETNF